jgi:hypothetical protein
MSKTCFPVFAGDELTTLLEEREAAFDERFTQTFGTLDGPDLPKGNPLIPHPDLPGN